jgi:hypothetical protein
LIVLTGTTDLLRSQTQRRLDRELIGYENLLPGINEDDEHQLLEVDYYGDPGLDRICPARRVAIDGRVSRITRIPQV